MQNLKLNSEKRQKFCLGKNIQEGERLRIVKNILEKSLAAKKLKLLKECNEITRTIEDIQSNTNALDEENLNEESTDSFYPASTSAYRSVTETRSNHSQPNKSYFSRKFKKQRAASRASRDVTKFDSDSFRSDLTKFTISKFDDIDMFTVDSGDTMWTNQRKCRNNQTDQDIRSEISNSKYDDEEPIQAKRSTRKLLSLRTKKTHDEMNSRCQIFPCTLLSTYTSMIDETRDRKSDKLQCVGFKSVINDRVASVLSSQSNANAYNFKLSDTNSSLHHTVKIELKDENINDNSIYKSEVDYLKANKSIRRPLKKEGSATNDLIFKIRALQTKVNYVREQNAINFKWTDRNARYGDPPPRNNIARQLRILSQFTESK